MNAVAEPRERWALGSVGLVVFVLPLLVLSRKLGLDGYLLPKELALHVGLLAVGSILLLGRKPQALTLGTVDVCIAAALSLGVVSAAVASVNPWLSLRALALAASGAGMFWIARTLTRAGDGERVIALVLLAWIAPALLAAAEAAGLIPSLSMPGRTPGSTIGNRNFLAHALLLVVPFVVRAILRALNRVSLAAWCAVLALFVQVMVLTRCRTAWLAAGSLFVFGAALALVWSRRAALDRGRLLLVALVVAASGALSWSGVGSAMTASRDYADTASRLLAYESGTGRGRLVQYANTLSMIRERPLLGVGPGNWTVMYAAFASVEDPNLRARAFQPVNRLPNNDWLGIAAEAGIPALLAVIAAGFALLASGWRSVRAEVPDSRAAAGMAAVLALALQGLTDAVLLRPEPLLTMALLAGAAFRVTPRWEFELASSARRAALAAAACAWLGFSGYAAVRVRAGILQSRGGRENQELAFALDRGNYALGARLAWDDFVEGSCDSAAHRAEQVLSISPYVERASDIIGHCERRIGRH